MWLYRLNHVTGQLIRPYWRLGLVGPVDKIPRQGGLLLASNHQSFLDPWFIGISFPRMIRYLARDTLFGPRGQMRLHGRVLRYVGAVPIKRDGGGARETLRAAHEQLAAGEVLLIFPEGTRTRDGSLQRCRRGVGMPAVTNSAWSMPIWTK